MVFLKRKDCKNPERVLWGDQEKMELGGKNGGS